MATEVFERIVANAELVRALVRERLGEVLAYDRNGIVWLDAYLTAQHASAAEELKLRMVDTLGAYLGECVRLTYGGSWCLDPAHGWMVRVVDDLAVYPFHKVRKHLMHGGEESVLSLFDVVHAVLEGRARVEDCGG